MSDVRMLRRIANLRAKVADLSREVEMLAVLLLPNENEVTPGSTGCQHPKERRLDAATFEQPGSWICGLCDHQGGLKEMVEHGCR